MFEPIRGGTRGGQAEFKWADVSADKDRENYLGHSVNAPTGRWQKNKDVHWYNRDVKMTDAERDEEIRKIKEAEAEALSVALGFGPSQKIGTAVGPTSGANAIPTGVPKGEAAESRDADKQKSLEKEERRRLKAERKALKQAQKEEHRAERPHRRRHEGDDDTHDRDYRTGRDRWRSRSPVPRDSKDYHPRHSRSRHSYSRSRSPVYDGRRSESRAKDAPWERVQDRDRDRRRYERDGREAARSSHRERF